jgi:hypothetical protein
LKIENYSQFVPESSFYFALKKEMKLTFLTILIFITTTYGVNAQKLSAKNVPSVVVNNFKKLYRKASDVSWEKVDKLYKVEFDFEGKDDVKIWFDESLRIAKQVENIAIGEMPRKINAFLQQNYRRYKIDDIQKIVLNGIVNYEVEVEHKDREKLLTFNNQGELISAIEKD